VNGRSSLAKQTQSIIETDKEIIPIYNFVREKEFPTQHENVGNSFSRTKL
jgi:hypothetical protein